VGLAPAVALGAALLLAGGCTTDAGPGGVPGPDPTSDFPSVSTPPSTSAGTLPTTSTPVPERPPNVLIVLTDDQRTGTLDVMPQTRRWFASGGTTYVNAYATTPLCCPSRATIFTGRYAHNHGVRGNTEAGRLDQRLTLQRYLRDAGYLTGYAGKYLNSWDLARDPPSFDRWTIFDRGYEGRTFNVDGSLRLTDEYSTRFIGEAAESYLREFEAQDERPWLLFVAVYAPHEPWTPEPQFADAAVPSWDPDPSVEEADLSDKPPAVRSMHFARDGQFDLGDVADIRSQQLRTLLTVDQVVGRLFSLLGELEEGQETLALFMSDNGFLWGDHGLAGIGLDTGKRYPYTAAVQVPMLLRWPGHIPAGGIDERLVANLDITPTVLDAAGLGDASEIELDGRSLLHPGESWRDELLLESFTDPTYPQAPPWAALRSMTAQYTEWYAADGQTVVFREYYDLAADPWQLENLLADGISENDPDVAALTTGLASARACSGASNCP
jgi:arylsulfatase A-like enzyme